MTDFTAYARIYIYARMYIFYWALAAEEIGFSIQENWDVDMVEITHQRSELLRWVTGKIWVVATGRWSSRRITGAFFSSSQVSDNCFVEFRSSVSNILDKALENLSFHLASSRRQSSRLPLVILILIVLFVSGGWHRRGKTEDDDLEKQRKAEHKKKFLTLNSRNINIETEKK